VRVVADDVAQHVKDARSREEGQVWLAGQRDAHAKLVREELRRATDVGEACSRAQLQAACALGAGDLEAALASLREAGEITEVTPDVFELITEGEREERDALDEEEVERAAVEAGEPMTLPGSERPPAGAHLAREARRPFADLLASQETTVKLTKAIADVLDEGTLGAIVKAGVAEAGERPFRLEVV